MATRERLATLRDVGGNTGADSIDHLAAVKEEVKEGSRKGQGGAKER